MCAIHKFSKQDSVMSYCVIYEYWKRYLGFLCNWWYSVNPGGVLGLRPPPDFGVRMLWGSFGLHETLLFDNAQEYEWEHFQKWGFSEIERFVYFKKNFRGWYPQSCATCFRLLNFPSVELLGPTTPIFKLGPTAPPINASEWWMQQTGIYWCMQ